MFKVQIQNKNSVIKFEWICRQCSMIYDPVVGAPDSGIALGTPFAAISDDWKYPICGAEKKLFTSYEEAIAA